jgi:hypothetical protein
VKRAMLFAALFSSACVGQILGGGAGDDDDGPDDGPRNLCDGAEADVAGPRLLRRLTSPELTASIRYAFGLSAAEWAGPAVPADPASADGFTNNVDRLVVDESYARGLYATATGVADVVVSETVLPRVLPCSGGGGADCARTFVQTVGRRLYRRPLTEAETARYLELHDRIAPAEGFAEFVRVAISKPVRR